MLKTEPDWTTLAPATPSAIRRLLRRCLEKDRKRRLPDAADARLEIDEALAAPSSAEGGASGTRSAARGRFAWVTALAAAAVDVVSLAIPALRHLRETPPPAPPETRLEIVTPSTEDLVSFALSPDGRQIVFVASGDGASRLWLRSLATTIAQPLMRVAATGGTATPVTAPDAQQGHLLPQFLSDGRFLFFIRGESDVTGIYLGALDVSTPTRLMVSRSGGAYLPSRGLASGDPRRTDAANDDGSRSLSA